MSETITENATFSLPSQLTIPSLQPFTIDTLVEVRTGRIQRLYSTPATSAIHKTPRKGPVRVTELGCESDEHAFEKHGGLDKALLHYCSEHYLKWRTELPENAHRFSVGGFGENLVSAKMNEENICIGDVIQIGSEVIVSVTEPRMPCYKLNHRFEFKDMSRQTQEKSRTGWLYRVLQTGYIQAGDQIVLLDRPHPQWTIAAVQKYLHKDKKNMEAMKELVELPELGQAIKDLFSNRLHQNPENELSRLLGDDSMALTAWSDYKVVEKRCETPRICSFVLQAVDPAKIDHEILPGSHVRLKLTGKLTRAYSVVGGTINCLEIGVGLESQSRGGSRYLHEAVEEGDILSISQIVPSFPLYTDADHHILIAGGIGITAFVVAAEQLKQEGQSFEVHLAVRSAQEVPFRERLNKLSPNIVIHDKSAGQPLSLSTILSSASNRTHVYCCGPPRLMEGVTAAARANNIPSANVHFEAFQTATSGDPFTVEIANRGETIEVGSNQTLLEALRDCGLDIPSSCETGNCATCRVNVCEGRIEHRGTGLMESEKGSAMLSCVSRGIGRIVIEA